MILIPSSNYKKSLWKNGLGHTQEIMIYPEVATFANEDFLWRLSSAQIKNDTDFSVFKNYDRLLTVIGGKGIILNDQTVQPLTVSRFSGDDVTKCQLIHEAVSDLGLIYNRDLIHATMVIKTFSANEDDHFFDLSDGTHLIYCLNGAFSTNGIMVTAQDTLVIYGATESKVTLLKPSTYVHIKICELKNKPDFCKTMDND